MPHPNNEHRSPLETPHKPEGEFEERMQQLEAVMTDRRAPIAQQVAALNDAYEYFSRGIGKERDVCAETCDRLVRETRKLLKDIGIDPNLIEEQFPLAPAVESPEEARQRDVFGAMLQQLSLYHDRLRQDIGSRKSPAQILEAVKHLDAQAIFRTLVERYPEKMQEFAAALLADETTLRAKVEDIIATVRDHQQEGIPNLDSALCRRVLMGLQHVVTPLSARGLDGYLGRLPQRDVMLSMRPESHETALTSWNTSPAIVQINAGGTKIVYHGTLRHSRDADDIARLEEAFRLGKRVSYVRKFDYDDVAALATDLPGGFKLRGRVLAQEDRRRVERAVTFTGLGAAAVRIEIEGEPTLENVQPGSAQFVQVLERLLPGFRLEPPDSLPVPPDPQHAAEQQPVAAADMSPAEHQ